MCACKLPHPPTLTLPTSPPTLTLTLPTKKSCMKRSLRVKHRVHGLPNNSSQNNKQQVGGDSRLVETTGWWRQQAVNGHCLALDDREDWRWRRMENGTAKSSQSKYFELSAAQVNIWWRQLRKGADSVASRPRQNTQIYRPIKGHQERIRMGD